MVIADEVTIDCDQAASDDFQPWDFAPPYVTEATIDSLTNQIIELT